MQVRQSVAFSISLLYAEKDMSYQGLNCIIAKPIAIEDLVERVKEITMTKAE